MNSINAICKKFNLPEEIDAKIMSFSTHPVAQLVKNQEMKFSLCLVAV